MVNHIMNIVLSASTQMVIVPCIVTPIKLIAVIILHQTAVDIGYFQMDQRLEGTEIVMTSIGTGVVE